tara:strand:- start:283 stop:600 length:318 start_codon:yes stop_codon:yes gene_type:complete
MKQNSQKVIEEEIKNLFDICKKFFISIKNLIIILVNNSLTSIFNKANLMDKKELDENKGEISLIEPIQEIAEPSLELTKEEDHDDALSLFSQEVVEMINEEEKAA